MNPRPVSDALLRRRRAACAAIVGLCMAAGPVAAQPPDAGPVAGGQADGFDWTPTAYVQIDLRAFPDWQLADDETRLQREPFEFRRVRAGVDGTWRQLRFEFSVDPVDWNEPPVQDAWAEYRISRALRVRGGQFKLPGGREYGTSARRLGFLERSPLSNSLAAGRDLGAQADLRFGSRVRWEAGVFLGDGQGREHRAGTTFATRAQWTPVRQVEIAAYGSMGDVEGVPDTHDPAGPNGRATSSYRFFDRVYVQGRRTRIGADAEWRHEAWRATFEILRLDDERRGQAADFSDLPSVAGRALTAALRWQPRGPMVGLRYDRITFDDTGPGTAAASVRPRAADLRPRGSEGVTLSGGWRVSRWLRVIGETAVERYFEPRSAPMLDRPGPYWMCGVRLQVELP